MCIFTEPLLSNFELWKKGWSFKPAIEKLNFKYLYCNKALLFLLFLVKRKAKVANDTSFTINWTSKMWSFWWRNLWSLLLPKKCDMRWWVAFDFDQVNWKNNFVLYLILSFRQKFGLFLNQCELSKKIETFNPQFKSALLNIYAFTTFKSNILRYSFWAITFYTCVKNSSYNQTQVT